MDQDPEEPLPQDPSDDDDLEILDRILQEEQSNWDAEEGADAGDGEDSFYIFEEEGKAAASAHTPAGPERIAQRFLVVQELSSGVRGTLYEVLDRAHAERPCRLLLLSPTWLGAAPVEDLLARADQVRASSCTINHVSIIPFDEAGLGDQGGFWLSSCSVSGESLAQLMQRTGSLPPAHALEIIYQTLESLEYCDAKGLQHGALDAETISLAPRVRWSKENPFGVGVRISEMGLAKLAPSGNEGQDDLFACARLLAQLLTGVAFDPGSSSWASSAAAKKSMGLSEPLGVLLDTGLAADAGERYQSPRDFRIALERVPEFRPPAVVRKRSFVNNLLFVVLIAAVLYGTKARWWPAAENQAQDNQPAGTSQAELDAVRIESEKLLDEERRRSEKAAQELADSLAAQADQKTLSDGELAKLAGNLEAERLAAEAARNAEQEKGVEVDALTADLQDSQSRIQELETAAARRVRVAEETSNAAALAEVSADIERLLRALGEGNLVNAAQVVSELEQNELVVQAPLSPLAFFSDLIAAHENLAGLDSQADPFLQADLLGSSAASIERAKTSGRPVMTGDNDSELLDDGTRIAAYQGVLNSLDARLLAHRDELQAEFASLWSGTLKSPDQAPSLVLRQAAAVGDQAEGMLAFVKTYASHVEQRALKNGALQWDKLMELEHLGAWSAWLTNARVPGLEQEAARLANFGFARDFYGANPLPKAAPSFQRLITDEAWLMRLSLSASILDQTHGMRAKLGTRLLYHTRNEDGEETWRWDTILEDPNPPEGVDDSRLILQEFHDAQGNKRGERSLRLYRIGHRLYEGDKRPTELLNLALDGPAYAILPWHASDETTPPERLRVSPGALEAFRLRLKQEPWRTFVVESGRQTTLWTRELGLVRHTIPGRISHELVFAEFP